MVAVGNRKGNEMRARYSVSDPAEGIQTERGEARSIDEGKALCEEAAGPLRWTAKTKLVASGGSWRQETIGYVGRYLWEEPDSPWHVAGVFKA